MLRRWPPLTLFYFSGLCRAHLCPVDADAVGLTSWEVLRSWYTGGPQEMRAFVGEGPILTDDNPLVEYHHWLPSPDTQGALELERLRGKVSRHVH